MHSRSTVPAGRRGPSRQHPIGEGVSEVAPPPPTTRRSPGRGHRDAADLLDHDHRDPGQHARRAGHPRHPRRLRPARLARRPLRGRGHAARDPDGAGDRRPGRPARAGGPSWCRASSAFGIFGLLVGAGPDASRSCSGCGCCRASARPGLINLAVVLIGDHWSGLERAAAGRPERRGPHGVARRVPAARRAADRARRRGGCRSRPTPSAWPPRCSSGTGSTPTGPPPA